jgi:hypothetical protein
MLSETQHPIRPKWAYRVGSFLNIYFKKVDFNEGVLMFKASQNHKIS